MSGNRFAAAVRWFKTVACGVNQWWAIMSGAISIPFAFLAAFSTFAPRLLFAVLAYVSLWVLTIAQARRISELQKASPHKLVVSPGHQITSDNPNSIIISLNLWNASTPPAELHNTIGEFWTNQRFILRESIKPRVHIRAKRGSAIFAYYDLSVPMLHDSTSMIIVQWSFRVPNEDEFIPIGVRIRSSETPWQTEIWKVVRDGEKVRITPSGQRPT
jgi:hypothetical protein